MKFTATVLYSRMRYRGEFVAGFSGLQKGDECVLKTERGIDLGRVVSIPRELPEAESGFSGDGEILRSFADTYGDQILLKPESSGIGALVWALPIGAVVIAACGLGLAVRRWRRDPARAPTAEDRAIVERFRQDEEGDA